jgi:hypothetical protein
MMNTVDKAWVRFRVAWMPFRAVLLAVLLGTLVMMTSGCPDFSRQIQAQTANGIANGANAALTILQERYRQEGLAVLTEVHRSGGTEAEARAELQKVIDKWKPIWQAWETLRVAEDAWATAIEQGGDTAAVLAAMKKAYCGLMQLWPESIPAIPLAPIKCEESPAAPGEPVAAPGGPVEAPAKPPAPEPTPAPAPTEPVEAPPKEEQP